METSQEKITIGAPGSEYGNYLSSSWTRILGMAGAVLAVVFVFVLFFFQNRTVLLILGILLAACILALLWIIQIRKMLSYEDGKVMDKLQIHLIEHLDFDGKGKILDVGCGNGPLSIRLAKTYPDAKVTGVDIYDELSEYALMTSEANAVLEGVQKQVTFVEGDASKLKFSKNSFDCVVSNFVYHEINNEQDKADLLLESLRVLKPGGAFCFQDFFDRKKIYGDIDALIDTLKKAGIREIHYEGKVDKQAWIPRYVLSRFVIKDIGILYGKK